MSCTLCNRPTPDPPITGDTIEGIYCCQNCLEKAKTLEKPTLESSKTFDNRPGENVTETNENPTAFLTVEGMHCTSCESFIESQATKHDGIIDAQASYPTETAKITYDPNQISKNTLPEIVTKFGYTATLRENNSSSQETESIGRLLVGGFFGMMTMVWYILFLYPLYLGVPSNALLLDVSSTVGAYLIGNIWVMTTVVLGVTGYPIFRGAYVSLKAGEPNMDLLVALAAGMAYVYSSFIALQGGTDVYFDVAVVIILAVTFGNYYENRIKRRAIDQLSELTTNRVDEARRR
ncbi:MAG: cation transporter, partial [Halobacteriaceae archaeon]